MKKMLVLFLCILYFLPIELHAQVQVTTQPVKILLVPGHDDSEWGAQYGNIKEADMNLVLATNIFNILKQDPRLQVLMTRDENGYVKEFSDYFLNDRKKIISFKDKAKKSMQKKVDKGAFIPKSGVVHNSVNLDTAVKLYGINKWANENNVDILLSIHFNDHPRGDIWTIGKYTGLAVYFPDSQMKNSTKSLKLAKSIFAELSKKYSSSTYVKESEGLVSDQKLIALGANDTLDKNVSSVLVEYGYIYQKIFRKKSTRFQAYKDMANLTVKGLENYIFQK